MSLLQYLPAIYQDPSDGDQSAQGLFLSDFLRPFELVMLAPEGAGDSESLQSEISGMHRLFDPAGTPESFLTWLGGWVALALRSDLRPEKKRILLANIGHLYRIRGTRRYLEEVLKLYLDALPSVTDEDLPPLQIGAHSTVGADTYLGGGPSFFFRVTLAFAQREDKFVTRQRQMARDVIELERPAHTWYELRLIFPRMQLGVSSTVGVDTVVAP